MMKNGKHSVPGGKFIFKKCKIYLVKLDGTSYLFLFFCDYSELIVAF